MPYSNSANTIPGSSDPNPADAPEERAIAKRKKSVQDAILESMNCLQRSAVRVAKYKANGDARSLEIERRVQDRHIDRLSAIWKATR